MKKCLYNTKVMSILKSTALFSLSAQIVTGLLDFYVLTLPRSMEINLLRELLTLELMVQIVEGIFYVWLALYISTAVKITQKRYWDWAITTPVMLITLSSYFIYLRITREQGSEAIPSFLDIVENNYVNFVKIIFLNAFMLIFGYLGEIGVMKVMPSVFAGFIPFFAMFYLIYDQYAKYTPDGMTLFYYFVFIWGLYGVAALMSYKWKNVCYNILDLFAKNFFGLFLAYLVYYSH